MPRTTIKYPESKDDWNFPDEFLEYLNALDKTRLDKISLISNDPIYPSYDYCWELEEEIPLRTILEYWNQTDKDIPEDNIILDEINSHMAETSYYDYINSF